MDRTVKIKKYEKEFLIKLLYQMLLIRRFEEKASQMYGLQKIGGFCHLYNGQEAVAVGAIENLDMTKDYVLAAYRDHGHALACGMSPESAMAELFGKSTGCSKGKGGSMHLFDAEKHMIGGNGIVGAHIPLAAGYGFKIRYLQEDGVVLCFFGDGAIHQGSFHETLNMAKIWKLPVVFICENNQYGMGTFYQRVSSVHDFSTMGASYGISGVQLNGMDVLEIYEGIGKCVEQARKEGEPALVEAKTYRYKGHSMSDPARYRTKDELEQYKEQDPVLILKTGMIDENLIDEEDYSVMDKEIRSSVNDAVRFAEESGEPAPEALYEDIYV